MKIIPVDYFVAYANLQKYTLSKHLAYIAKRKELIQPVIFRGSAVYSSLIEGSGINVEAYVENKRLKIKSKPMAQIDDLIKGYKYAQKQKLTESSFLKVHAIISPNLDITPEHIGAYRTKQAYVMSEKKVIYTAASTEIVATEMKKLFADLEELKTHSIRSFNEAFYIASMFHLVFVSIHPFADGNGRMARLLEKWVLFELLKKEEVWNIPSEANYWHYRERYYRYLNAIGKDYKKLNFARSIDFLLMLPESFKLSKRLYIAV